jgi:hypothetical protein
LTISNGQSSVQERHRHKSFNAKTAKHKVAERLGMRQSSGALGLAQTNTPRSSFWRGQQQTMGFPAIFEWTTGTNGV